MKKILLSGLLYLFTTNVSFGLDNETKQIPCVEKDTFNEVLTKLEYVPLMRVKSKDTTNSGDILVFITKGNLLFVQTSDYNKFCILGEGSNLEVSKETLEKIQIGKPGVNL